MVKMKKNKRKIRTKQKQQKTRRVGGQGGRGRRRRGQEEERQVSWVGEESQPRELTMARRRYVVLGIMGYDGG